VKPVQLATSVQGGAGIAARRLNDALRREGVESRMVVRYSGGVEGVEQVEPVRRDLIGKVVGRVDAWRFRRERNRYRTTEPAGRSYVRDDRVPGIYCLDPASLHADVLNLHWIVGLIEAGSFFARLPRGMPVVWTLHDMHPFTGGCHYAAGCDGFLARCGSCPQLGSSDPDDLSARVHRRREQAYASLMRATTRIVTPSRWLASEARRSTLVGDFHVETIPNSVDTEIFRPGDKAAARAAFALPAHGPVLVFVAENTGLHLKGLDLLETALCSPGIAKGVTLAVIGSKPARFATDSRIAWLGTIDTEARMAQALCAADVFVAPSRVDNLPNVLLEALACGTPVVGFDNGGIADVIRPQVTGLLAESENVTSLAACIDQLLRDEGLRARLSLACRTVAEKEYAPAVQAHRYMRLYESLLEASRAGR
jgi:glycosyltransferase involved in cell wall biosynthesis